MATGNMELLGRYVAERRLQLGLSQEDIAARGGPSTTTLSKIENGTAKAIRSRTVVDLERALGWRPESVWEILYNNDPPRLVTAAVAEASVRAVTADVSAGDGEGESVRAHLVLDDDGQKMFVGSSWWKDPEGRAWRYEVRLWPADDVGAYVTDFMSVLAATGRAVREQMPIYRDGETPVDWALSQHEDAYVRAADNDDHEDEIESTGGER